jgi:hypothetical protein
MSLLRGLLLDNLGLKLVALLLAVVVYLNVFTDRPATMIVSFPLQFTDLADSLSLAGPVSPAVQAELRGTGKQFIRLWLTEPRIKVSLAGERPGRQRRTLNGDDLPLLPSDNLKVERLLGPGVIEVQIEPRVSRRVPVAARVEGIPRDGMIWSGTVLVEPPEVLVHGPEMAVGMLDSVRLEPVRIDGRRDTVRTVAKATDLPEWCTVEPSGATVTVPLGRPPR